MARSIYRSLISDVRCSDRCCSWRYAGCMRYGQGGGLTAEGRRRREQVRLEAVKRFEQRAPSAVVAAELGSVCGRCGGGGRPGWLGARPGWRPGGRPHGAGWMSSSWRRWMRCWMPGRWPRGTRTSGGRRANRPLTASHTSVIAAPAIVWPANCARGCTGPSSTTSSAGTTPAGSIPLSVISARPNTSQPTTTPPDRRHDQLKQPVCQSGSSPDP